VVEKDREEGERTEEERRTGRWVTKMRREVQRGRKKDEDKEISIERRGEGRN